MDKATLNKTLEPLKPFQRRTVALAFDRLFGSDSLSGRFLVADEPGLGKTLVARGVVAKTIHHLWETVGRIDIIYICSNSRIAQSNLAKLRIGSESTRAFASRLTLLVRDLASDTMSLSNNKLNFVSFTPGTSFNLRSQGGRFDERVVLFHLLKHQFTHTTQLKNLLQLTIKKRETWEYHLGRDIKLDPDISERFLERYNKSDVKPRLERFLSSYCKRFRSHWPWEIQSQRTRLIGELRAMLAEASVESLEPDLVILDEFQRFKELLDTTYQSAASELAQSMFTAVTPEGNDVRTLLLSATPYKFFTTNEELDFDDHYADFLKTTRFLFRDKTEYVDQLRRDIKDFGNGITNLDSSSLTEVEKVKCRIESTLSLVMSRTERVSATANQDAMVTEKSLSLTLSSFDVNQYLGTDALFKEVGDRDPIPFWKSASYITQFMHGYKFNNLFTKHLEAQPTDLQQLVASNKECLLRRSALEQRERVDPGNAKIRDLAAFYFDRGWEKLLWVPPTVPYWSPAGPFKGVERETKTLLFSHWNVVPDVISGLLSYEAERRMVRGDSAVYEGLYEELSKKASTPLRLDSIPERTSHRSLLLLLPCLPLADLHPLEALKLGKPPRKWIRSRISELLKKLPNPKLGKVDKRWEWAAPILLDPDLTRLFDEWENSESDLPLASSTHLREYLDDTRKIRPQDLGRRPPGLVDLLTDIALGSPAVIAARTCAMHGQIQASDHRRLSGLNIAGAFWHLFNRPAVTYLIRNIYSQLFGKQTGYWRFVLKYCEQGNLQAVLDEHWHWLRGENSWGDSETSAELIDKCVGALKATIVPNPSRVHLRTFDQMAEGQSETPDPSELRLRTVFALRYGGNVLEEDGRRLTDDTIRKAFNSPFRPFVLASTSIGQEGLDFHPWCHRIIHWDLPTNPVDFEQREGRVHRYKGHAIRRNVAVQWESQAKRNWKFGDDLWELIFNLAEAQARQDKKSDLVPCWISEGEYRVERRVPLLPYAREEASFQDLMRQLATYRVVFGQSRQEELIRLLEQSNLTMDAIQQLAINLEPPS